MEHFVNPIMHIYIYIYVCVCVCAFTQHLRMSSIWEKVKF